MARTRGISRWARRPYFISTSGILQCIIITDNINNTFHRNNNNYNTEPQILIYTMSCFSFLLNHFFNSDLFFASHCLIVGNFLREGMSFMS